MEIVTRINLAERSDDHCVRLKNYFFKRHMNLNIKLLITTYFYFLRNNYLLILSYYVSSEIAMFGIQF